MTSDRLFSSKDLVLKHKVVLQLCRLCLLANFPASMITRAPGGRGGGGGGRELGRGVRLASQNPYPIYDQNLRFSLPYI